MKRCEFQMHPADYKAMATVARTAGSNCSEFIRQAVVEKLSRELAVGRLDSAAEKLSDLVQEIRAEVGRTRKDLLDDSQRVNALLREDIGKSMKKNEELQKTFVLMLGGHASPSTPPTRPRPVRDDDAPMQVPG